MPFRRRILIAVLAATVAAGQIGSRARAEDLKAAYQAQIGWTLHLLETGRYAEAEDSAQSLVNAYPDAALPFELRGTTALYVGSVGRAQKDFTRAAAVSRDPETQYGLALCALFTRRTEAAADALSQAAVMPGLTGTQSADLETAQAYVGFLRGDLAGTQKILDRPGAADDPLRTEIRALLTHRQNAEAGRAEITAFLTTPEGVPKLQEDAGLRPLFESARPLEACVVEPELQQMYADRMAGGIMEASRRTGGVLLCTGNVLLTPPETVPIRAALVSYSVDGQIAAIVSQSPYRFSWNTAHTPNGTHTVRIDASDASGNTLMSQTQTVRVKNQESLTAVPGPEEAEVTGLRARLWHLLRLRPCRKVAEWTLGQAARAAGDRISADAHLAAAAALDPAYQNGQQFARQLFSRVHSPAATVGPVAHVASARPVVLWTGSSGRQEIALTFDDGPNPVKTTALLNALDSAQAPATFFIVGSRAALAPDLLRRMASRGDEVENHSFTHPNMNLIIPAAAEGEILRTSVLIRALTGHQPRFFRPPGGNANSSVQRLAQEYGLSLAYWTVDAIHAEDLGSPQGLVEYVTTHVHPGSIVLLHNGPDVTTAAIPALVAGLRAKGYKLVTLAQLAQGQKITPEKPAAMPKMKE